LEEDATAGNPDAVVASLLAAEANVPLALHLAAKLAKSRHFVANLKGPAKLSVVFAIYKEHHRLLRPDEHGAGEDFLRRKVGQLDWLASASPNLSWELLAVDDGCPEGSGKLIEELAKDEGFDKVRVLYLEEAIRQNLPITGSLDSTDQSRKGGSIIYGLWEACQRKEADMDQVVIFTDADLSTHLGQAGLLLDPILNGDKDVAMGSRRETASVVVKKGTRNLRGKLFIYLWKRMLSPALLEIIDTQCGFKAFRADTARAILDDLLERGFAFDVELLLKAEQRNPNGLAKVPIAWIDSEAESTTTALSPYLTMLQGIAAMNRKYLPPNPEAEAFVTFIERLDENQWNQLVDNVPKAIATRNPQDFGHFDEVSPDDLQAILQDE
jgi:glycosyltransferase involved in cell wall biosynthesis